MGDFSKTNHSDDFTKTEWFVLGLSCCTIPFIGWWAALPIFCALGWAGTRQEERKKSPLFREEPDWYKPRTPEDVVIPKRDDHSWDRHIPAPIGSAESAEKGVVEVKTLAITNHARRNLALRHGIITELTHLDYEELTLFEEEGEGCYITSFPDINKSKEFAVFLDEDKVVIKTFCPHTDYNRNRAYFKKHTNLDNALKDDMTKDLEFLQKVWLDKIA